ncbi:helix-turn-helix domain-containing protein [Streptomyces sp. ST2-7A]|uniref:helix-turn-helix domain-containing protein n=1 Tax=Streptomyces sp. ST2-7A TaxID=2907214 RepID=UPI001F3E8CA8|nr:helix-turn-helix transcriptional regulator [Streptomyces sp. ST2-7A]MCE7082427.1 helix-turn-helix domain-containing protein [Streptomyces sp. ST2-7A]
MAGSERSPRIGERIAYHRRIARLTQQRLADTSGIALGTIRKIERGERGASESTLDRIADALHIDPVHLHGTPERGETRVHHAMRQLSGILACHEDPDDRAFDSPSALRARVEKMTAHRLAARYTPISRQAPELLEELFRAFHTSSHGDRKSTGKLLVMALRSADAVAYKHRALDLSARLIDTMRWTADRVGDPLLAGMVAYVRTETFFATETHTAGLRALERAIDLSPSPTTADSTASLGALHMRAAVIAGRSRNSTAAGAHISEARELADRVPEGVYNGTAFGPHSLRIHEISLAVSLGDGHAHRALEISREWRPPSGTLPERHSSFHIELARAQLWAGRPGEAFDSLKAARRVAPQHTREHPWVREDVATLRRLRRGSAEELTRFATWCEAGG